jgi:hypothetical protein
VVARPLPSSTDEASCRAMATTTLAGSGAAQAATRVTVALSCVVA